MVSIKKYSFEFITILGPTASGKTKLAVQIAYLFNGEIISADSRQVYKEMDIGTGKDLSEYKIHGLEIPYHLINILHPTENYSVYHFQKDFYQALEIIDDKKLPILCGGTGLYLESILLKYNLKNTPINHNLREKLELEDINVLKNKLKNIDKNLYHKWKLDTKRRIIRGIELAKANANPEITPENKNPHKTVILGIYFPRETIREKITKRLKERIENGMIEEVERLLYNGLSKKRLNYFGLEYKFIRKYLDNEISLDEMFELLNIAIHQFSKRQMSWFRRMEKRGLKINWLDGNDYQSAIKIIKKFKN